MTIKLIILVIVFSFLFSSGLVALVQYLLVGPPEQRLTFGKEKKKVNRRLRKAAEKFFANPANKGKLFVMEEQLGSRHKTPKEFGMSRRNRKRK